MTTLGELIVKLSLDTSNFQKQIKDIQSNISKSKDSLGLDLEANISANKASFNNLAKELKTAEKHLDTTIKYYNDNSIKIKVNDSELNNLEKRIKSLALINKIVNIEVNVDDSELNNLEKRIRSFTLLGSLVAVKATVDDSELDDLNQHLDKKVQHSKEVNNYFASNPIKPRVDSSALDNLNKQLDDLTSNSYEIPVSFLIDKNSVEKTKQLVSLSIELGLTEGIRNGLTNTSSAIESVIKSSTSNALRRAFTEKQNINIQQNVTTKSSNTSQVTSSIVERNKEKTASNRSSKENREGNANSLGLNQLPNLLLNSFGKLGQITQSLGPAIRSGINTSIERLRRVFTGGKAIIQGKGESQSSGSKDKTIEAKVLIDSSNIEEIKDDLEKAENVLLETINTFDSGRITPVVNLDNINNLKNNLSGLKNDLNNLIAHYSSSAISLQINPDSQANVKKLIQDLTNIFNIVNNLILDIKVNDTNLTNIEQRINAIKQNPHAVNIVYNLSNLNLDEAISTNDKTIQIQINNDFINILRNDIQEIKTSFATIFSEVSDNADLAVVTNIKNKLKELEDSFSDIVNNLNGILNNLSEKQIQFNISEESYVNINNISNNLNSLRNIIIQVEEEINKLNAALNDTSNDSNLAQTSINNLSTKLDEIKGKLDNEISLSINQSSIENAISQLDTAIENIQVKLKSLNATPTQSSEVDNQKTTVDFDVNAQKLVTELGGVKNILNDAIEYFSNNSINLNINELNTSSLIEDINNLRNLLNQLIEVKDVEISITTQNQNLNQIVEQINNVINSLELLQSTKTQSININASEDIGADLLNSLNTFKNSIESKIDEINTEINNKPIEINTSEVRNQVEQTQQYLDSNTLVVRINLNEIDKDNISNAINEVCEVVKAKKQELENITLNIRPVNTENLDSTKQSIDNLTETIENLNNNKTVEINIFFRSDISNYSENIEQINNSLAGLALSGVVEIRAYLSADVLEQSQDIVNRFRSELQKTPVGITLSIANLESFKSLIQRTIADLSDIRIAAFVDGDFSNFTATATANANAVEENNKKIASLTKILNDLKQILDLEYNIDVNFSDYENLILKIDEILIKINNLKNNLSIDTTELVSSIKAIENATQKINELKASASVPVLFNIISNLDVNNENFEESLKAAENKINDFSNFVNNKIQEINDKKINITTEINNPLNAVSDVLDNIQLQALNVQLNPESENARAALLNLLNNLQELIDDNDLEYNISVNNPEEAIEQITKILESIKGIKKYLNDNVFKINFDDNSISSLDLLINNIILKLDTYKQAIESANSNVFIAKIDLTNLDEVNITSKIQIISDQLREGADALSAIKIAVPELDDTQISGGIESVNNLINAIIQLNQNNLSSINISFSGDNPNALREQINALVATLNSLQISGNITIQVAVNSAAESQIKAIIKECQDEINKNDNKVVIDFNVSNTVLNEVNSLLDSVTQVVNSKVLNLQIGNAVESLGHIQSSADRSQNSLNNLIQVLDNLKNKLAEEFNVKINANQINTLTENIQQKINSLQNLNIEEATNNQSINLDFQINRQSAIERLTELLTNLQSILNNNILSINVNLQNLNEIINQVNSICEVVKENNQCVLDNKVVFGVDEQSAQKVTSSISAIGEALRQYKLDLEAVNQTSITTHLQSVNEAVKEIDKNVKSLTANLKTPLNIVINQTPDLNNLSEILQLLDNTAKSIKNTFDSDINIDLKGIPVVDDFIAKLEELRESIISISDLSKVKIGMLDDTSNFLIQANQIIEKLKEITSLADNVRNVISGHQALNESTGTSTQKEQVKSNLADVDASLVNFTQGMNQVKSYLTDLKTFVNDSTTIARNIESLKNLLNQFENLSLDIKNIDSFRQLQELTSNVIQNLSNFDKNYEIEITVKEAESLAGDLRKISNLILENFNTVNLIEINVDLSKFEESLKSVPFAADDLAEKINKKLNLLKAEIKIDDASLLNSVNESLNLIKQALNEFNFKLSVGTNSKEIADNIHLICEAAKDTQKCLNNNEINIKYNLESFSNLNNLIKQLTESLEKLEAAAKKVNNIKIELPQIKQLEYANVTQDSSQLSKKTIDSSKSTESKKQFIVTQQPNPQIEMSLESNEVENINERIAELEKQANSLTAKSLKELETILNASITDKNIILQDVIKWAKSFASIIDNAVELSKEDTSGSYKGNIEKIINKTKTVILKFQKIYLDKLNPSDALDVLEAFENELKGLGQTENKIIDFVFNQKKLIASINKIASKLPTTNSSTRLDDILNQSLNLKNIAKSINPTKPENLATKYKEKLTKIQQEIIESIQKTGGVDPATINESINKALNAIEKTITNKIANSGKKIDTSFIDTFKQELINNVSDANKAISSQGLDFIYNYIKNTANVASMQDADIPSTPNQQFLQDDFIKITNLYKEVNDTFIQQIKEILPKIQSLNIDAEVFALLKTLSKYIKDNVLDVKNKLESTSESYKTAYSSTPQQSRQINQSKASAIEGIDDSYKNVGKNIVDTFESQIALLDDESIKDEFKKVLQGIKDVFGIASPAKKIIEVAVNITKTFFDSIKNGFKAGRLIIDNIIQGLFRQFGEIKDIPDHLFDLNIAKPELGEFRKLEDYIEIYKHLREELLTDENQKRELDDYSKAGKLNFINPRQNLDKIQNPYNSKKIDDIRNEKLEDVIGIIMNSRGQIIEEFNIAKERSEKYVQFDSDKLFLKIYEAARKSNDKIFYSVAHNHPNFAKKGYAPRNSVITSQQDHNSIGLMKILLQLSAKIKRSEGHKPIHMKPLPEIVVAGKGTALFDGKDSWIPAITSNLKRFEKIYSQEELDKLYKQFQSDFDFYFKTLIKKYKDNDELLVDIKELREKMSLYSRKEFNNLLAKMYKDKLVNFKELEKSGIHDAGARTNYLLQVTTAPVNPKVGKDGKRNLASERTGIAEAVQLTPKAIKQNLIQNPIDYVIDDSYKNIGKNIVDTFESQIASIDNQVIKNAFEGVLKIIKKVFGIASPSTELRDVGYNVVHSYSNSVVAELAVVTHAIGKAFLNTINPSIIIKKAKETGEKVAEIREEIKKLEDKRLEKQGELESELTGLREEKIRVESISHDTSSAVLEKQASKNKKIKETEKAVSKLNEEKARIEGLTVFSEVKKKERDREIENQKKIARQPISDLEKERREISANKKLNEEDKKERIQSINQKIREKSLEVEKEIQKLEEQKQLSISEKDKTAKIEKINKQIKQKELESKKELLRLDKEITALKKNETTAEESKKKELERLDKEIAKKEAELNSMNERVNKEILKKQNQIRFNDTEALERKKESKKDEKESIKAENEDKIIDLKRKNEQLEFLKTDVTSKERRGYKKELEGYEKERKETEKKLHLELSTGNKAELRELLEFEESSFDPDTAKIENLKEKIKLIENLEAELDNIEEEIKKVNAKNERNFTVKEEKELDENIENLINKLRELKENKKIKNKNFDEFINNEIKKLEDEDRILEEEFGRTLPEDIEERKEIQEKRDKLVEKMNRLDFDERRRGYTKEQKTRDDKEIKQTQAELKSLQNERTNRQKGKIGKEQKQKYEEQIKENKASIARLEEEIKQAEKEAMQAEKDYQNASRIDKFAKLSETYGKELDNIQDKVNAIKNTEEELIDKRKEAALKLKDLSDYEKDIIQGSDQKASAEMIQSLRARSEALNNEITKEENKAKKKIEELKNQKNKLEKELDKKIKKEQKFDIKAEFSQYTQQNIRKEIKAIIEHPDLSEEEKEIKLRNFKILLEGGQVEIEQYTDPIESEETKINLVTTEDYTEFQAISAPDASVHSEIVDDIKEASLPDPEKLSEGINKLTEINGLAKIAGEEFHNAISPLIELGNTIDDTFSPLTNVFYNISDFMSILTDKIIALGEEIIKLEPSLRKINSIVGEAKSGKEIDFAINASKQYNVSISDGLEAYGQLLAAAQNTKLEGQGIQDLYKGIASSINALGITGKDVTYILLAYTQILAKGKLSMEELRQQLGEKFPPAMEIFAQAIGKTIPELIDLTSQGAILSADILPNVGKILRARYEGSAQNASGLAITLTKLQNIGTEAVLHIIDSFELLIGIIPKAIINIADSFSILTNAIKGVTSAAIILSIAIAGIALLIAPAIFSGITASLAASTSLKGVIAVLQTSFPSTFKIIGIASGAAFHNGLNEFFGGRNPLKIITNAFSFISEYLSISLKPVLNTFKEFAKSISPVFSFLGGAFKGIFTVTAVHTIIQFLSKMASIILSQAIPAVIKLGSAFFSTFITIGLTSIKKIKISIGSLAKGAASLAITFGTLFLSAADFSVPFKEGFNDISKSIENAANAFRDFNNELKKTKGNKPNFSAYQSIPSKGFQLNPFVVIGVQGEEESYVEDERRKRINYAAHLVKSGKMSPEQLKDYYDEQVERGNLGSTYQPLTWFDKGYGSFKRQVDIGANDENKPKVYTKNQIKIAKELGMYGTIVRDTDYDALESVKMFLNNMLELKDSIEKDLFKEVEDNIKELKKYNQDKDSNFSQDKTKINKLINKQKELSEKRQKAFESNDEKEIDRIDKEYSNIEKEKQSIISRYSSKYKELENVKETLIKQKELAEKLFPGFKVGSFFDELIKKIDTFSKQYKDLLPKGAIPEIESRYTKIVSNLNKFTKAYDEYLQELEIESNEKEAEIYKNLDKGTISQSDADIQLLNLKINQLNKTFDAIDNEIKTKTQALNLLNSIPSSELGESDKERIEELQKEINKAKVDRSKASVDISKANLDLRNKIKDAKKQIEDYNLAVQKQIEDARFELRKAVIELNNRFSGKTLKLLLKGMGDNELTQLAQVVSEFITEINELALEKIQQEQKALEDARKDIEDKRKLSEAIQLLGKSANENVNAIKNFAQQSTATFKKLFEESFKELERLRKEMKFTNKQVSYIEESVDKTGKSMNRLGSGVLSLNRNLSDSVYKFALIKNYLSNIGSSKIVTISVQSNRQNTPNNNLPGNILPSIRPSHVSNPSSIQIANNNTGFNQGVKIASASLNLIGYERGNTSSSFNSSNRLNPKDYINFRKNNENEIALGFLKPKSKPLRYQAIPHDDNPTLEERLKTEEAMYNRLRNISNYRSSPINPNVEQIFLNVIQRSSYNQIVDFLNNPKYNNAKTTNYGMPEKEKRHFTLEAVKKRNEEREKLNFGDHAKNFGSRIPVIGGVIGDVVGTPLNILENYFLNKQESNRIPQHSKQIVPTLRKLNLRSVNSLDSQSILKLGNELQKAGLTSKQELVLPTNSVTLTPPIIDNLKKIGLITEKEAFNFLSYLYDKSLDDFFAPPNKTQKTKPVLDTKITEKEVFNFLSYLFDESLDDVFAPPNKTQKTRKPVPSDKTKTPLNAIITEDEKKYANRFLNNSQIEAKKLVLDIVKILQGTGTPANTASAIPVSNTAITTPANTASAIPVSNTAITIPANTASAIPVSNTTATGDPLLILVTKIISILDSATKCLCSHSNPTTGFQGSMPGLTSVSTNSTIKIPVSNQPLNISQDLVTQQQQALDAERKKQQLEDARLLRQNLEDQIKKIKDNILQEDSITNKQSEIDKITQDLDKIINNNTSFESQSIIEQSKSDLDSAKESVKKLTTEKTNLFSALKSIDAIFERYRKTIEGQVKEGLISRNDGSNLIKEMNDALQSSKSKAQERLNIINSKLPELQKKLDQARIRVNQNVSQNRKVTPDEKQKQELERALESYQRSLNQKEKELESIKQDPEKQDKILTTLNDITALKRKINDQQAEIQFLQEKIKVSLSTSGLTQDKIAEEVKKAESIRDKQKQNNNTQAIIETTLNEIQTNKDKTNLKILEAEAFGKDQTIEKLNIDLRVLDLKEKIQTAVLPQEEKDRLTRAVEGLAKIQKENLDYEQTKRFEESKIQTKLLTIQNYRNSGGNEFVANAQERDIKIKQKEKEYEKEKEDIENDPNLDDQQKKEKKEEAKAKRDAEIKEIENSAKSVVASIRDLIRNSLINDLSAGLTDVIMGVEKLDDVLNNLARNMLSGLINIAIKSLMQSLVGAGGILDSLFKSIGGIFGGNSGGEVPSANDGGEVFSQYKGGVIKNYAGGGIIQSLNEAIVREKAANGGITPVVAVLTPGERVLSVADNAKFQSMGLDKVIKNNNIESVMNYAMGGNVSNSELKVRNIMNFASGGVIPPSPGIGNINQPTTNTTVNVPITIESQDGDKSPSIDPNAMQNAIKTAVIVEIQRQQRQGGILKR
jgi:tape measure domain-containing protein